MRYFLLLSLVLAVLVSASLMGCATKRLEPIDQAPGKITAAENVRDVKQAHTYLGVQLNEFEEWLKTAPDTLPKAEVIARARTIRMAFDAETKPIEAAEKSVAKLTEKVISLEKKVNNLQDPEKAELRSAGLWWFIVPGLAVIGLYFAAGFIPVVGPWIQKGGKGVLFVGIALFVLGCTLITLAKFMAQVEFVVIGTLGTLFVGAIVTGGFYLWKHHKKIVAWIQEDEGAKVQPPPSP